MANVAAKTSRENVATNRPETQVSSEPKKAGRPKGSGEKKNAQGKAKYTGGVRNSAGKLTELPKDFDSSKHVRLREDDFASPELFTQHKAANKVERKYHPALIGEDGTPSNVLSEFPSDVTIVPSYDFEHDGEKIVGFRTRHFTDRRILARAIVPALEAEIARLNKVAKMTDEQLERYTKREGLQKAIEKKAKELQGGKSIDPEKLQQALAILGLGE